MDGKLIVNLDNCKVSKVYYVEFVKLVGLYTPYVFLPFRYLG